MPAGMAGSKRTPVFTVSFATNVTSGGRSGVAADARGHMPPVSSARADSVAGGFGARPGQRPLPAEQDLREALRGVLAGPVALQLTSHLDHAGRLAAGQGDAVQPGLVRLGRVPPTASVTG